MAYNDPFRDDYGARNTNPGQQQLQPGSQVPTLGYSYAAPHDEHHPDDLEEPPRSPTSHGRGLYAAPGAGYSDEHANLSKVSLGGGSKYNMGQDSAHFDDEEQPLRDAGYGASPGGFNVPGGAYPPNLPSDPTAAFGFPRPQISFSNAQGGQNPDRQSSATSLYRSQTSAEAWQRRQRIEPGRAKTVKVTLKQGNFVNEYPVPTPVLNANLAGGYKAEPTEFSHMRYSAVTVDPDDFTNEGGWTLRQETYGRDTELCVAITYYNEDKILVARTLHGVMLNLRDICKAKWSEFRRKAEQGGPEFGTTEAWKRIVVTLVFDGIEPADKATLDVLATIGLYQDAVMKREIDGKETQLHLFEYTTCLSMSPKPELVQPRQGDPANMVPVQMILCLKQKNAKKINSHRWLFNAIGKHLQPEVCILIDAGTKPGARSLYYLWEAFHHNKHLGGACGEIHAMLAKGKKLLNPLVAAQNFEYKMSNILDKPLESSFGYVSVLPGAFSAYRYQAIQGRPLQQYFHGDHTMSARLGKKGVDGMNIFKKNMFLAEDRILCFELVAKANAQWVLGYVKPAKGETDVPESAAELIGQRRRWLNGSFAAGVYALVHFPRMYKSNHGIVRMFFFHLQAFYTTAGLVMSWFALANWYITFSAIIEIVAGDWRNPFHAAGLEPNSTRVGGDATALQKAQDDVSWKILDCWSGSMFDDTAHLKDPSQPTKSKWLEDVNTGLEMAYISLVVLQIILALGNRPKGERWAYTGSIVLFALFATYLFAATMVLTVQAFCPLNEQIALSQAGGGSVISAFLGSTYGPIFAGLAGTFGIYIISSVIYLDPWHLFHSMPPYLSIAISFTNILNVYAFCNLHDVSWGTKGSDKAEALPAVVSKNDNKEGGEKVVNDVHRTQDDLDAVFQQTVLRAVQPFKESEAVEKPNQDDQNRTFRTRWISSWLLMNAILAVAISRVSDSTRTYYFQALLWITFGLSGVRFMGFMWYMTGEWFFRVARLCARARG